MTATVEQTQADLPRMLELARQGEEVVITRSGEPIAKLTGFVSVRPPGYFADCYDAEEIHESNEFGPKGRPVRQWDIYLFPFSEELPHPAVIISNDERCENADLDAVNALICTTAQLNRPPRKNEIILDEADGLDWKTAVRCDVVYLLPKAEFTERRGQVSLPRRALIARKIAECLRLPASW